MGNEEYFDEKLMSTALKELNKCESYWARKAKLATFSNRPGYKTNKFNLQLIEFDVALHFKNAEDVARVSEQMFDAYPSSSHVKEKIKAVLSLLVQSSQSQFARDLMKYIPAKHLLKMFFSSYPEEDSVIGSLRIYLTLVVHNPYSMDVIANKLFDSYLAAKQQYNRQVPKDAGRDMDLTPYDLVFFHISKQLVERNFGNMSEGNATTVLHTVLKCAFHRSHIPDSFHSQNLTDFGISHPAGDWWHICLNILIALLKKTNNHSKKLAILLANSSSNFIQLTETLFAPNEPVDLVTDIEVIRFFLCYAVSKTGELHKGATRLLALIPANIYNIGAEALDDYWLDYVVDKRNTTGSAIHRVKGNCGADCLEGLSMVHSISRQAPVICEQTLLSSLLFPSLGVHNQLAILIQSLLLHGNYEIASFYVSKAIKSVDGKDAEQRKVLLVQYLQICLALKSHPEFKLNNANLKIFLEVISQTADEEEFSFSIHISQESSFVYICEGNIQTYALLSLFYMIYYLMVRLEVEHKNVAHKTFLLAFLTIICQTFWDQIGFYLFPQLMEHITLLEKFECPGLTKHLSNVVILNCFTALPNVQLCIGGKEQFVSGEQLCQMVLTGEVTLSTSASLLNDLTSFITLNKQQLTQIFLVFDKV